MPEPSSAAVLPLSGPCAGARKDVDSRCAEAARLAQAAAAHQERLRELRRELMEVEAKRDVDVRVLDRRQLSATKDAARKAYRSHIVRSRSEPAVRETTRRWLREIDQLNRQFAMAESRADDLLRKEGELEQALAGAELTANAARIAAEAAQESCLAARQTLAQCEENAVRGAAARTPATGASNGRAAGHAAPVRLTSPTPGHRGVRPISLVLQGDRGTLTSISRRLADETGFEPGRLQLLLLELREQIAARALDDEELSFPPEHPFWSQFTSADARLIAVNLAAMGYNFDGRSGWQDGVVPRVRELSVAVSNVGLDPRGHMRPVSQPSIETLWKGTTVRVEDYLAAHAPDLDLQEMITCLGPNSSRLSDLWDMWGRLRPLLLTPA
ncbi:MAG TPA: hypothetical protein VH371_02340 [Candidatus Limnocylindrales bacterium]